MALIPFPRRTLRIRLQYQERMLHEVRSTDLTRDIDIGRGLSCLWQVPSEDATVGHHHATLSRQGRDVVIRDQGSRNGIWFRNQRIAERKLKPGDRISLGKSVLVVDVDEPPKTVKGEPELLVMTGAHRKQRRVLGDTVLTIGSSPEAGLMLTDEYVSREHASIIRKGESGFWLKALKSTNPTKLNDEPLAAGQERALKDRDRISIAHVSLLFRDGASLHAEQDVLRTLGVMVVAILLASGLYLGWQSVRDSARDCLNRARQLKLEGRFPEALAQLDRANGRRGFSDLSGDVAQLRRETAACNSALQLWNRAQTEVRSAEWAKAATTLGSILPSPPDPSMWAWQDGQKFRDRALDLKSHLDALLDAGNTDVVGLPMLLEKNTALANHAAKLAGIEDLAALRDIMLKRHQELLVVAADYGRLDAAIKLVSASNADRTLLEVEAGATNPAVVVRRRAESLLLPLRGLSTSLASLGRAVDLARETRFREIADLGDGLPAPDLCGVDTNLVRFRQELDYRWKNLKLQSAAAAARWRSLTNRIPDTTTKPPELEYWADPTVLARILDCDSLRLPCVKRDRRDPVGEYDRALSVEWFFRSLVTLQTQPDDTTDAQFEGRLSAARRTLTAAREFADLLKQDGHRWLRRGKLDEWARTAEGILARRDAIVANLAQLAARESGRRAVIAAGIAVHLGDARGPAARDDLARRFLELRGEVKKLYAARDAAGASLEARVDLRRKILETGLPGDPIVREMWLEGTLPNAAPSTGRPGNPTP